MTDDFDIDRDIPAELWLLLDPRKGGADEFRARMEVATREHLVAAFKGFLDAKTELAYLLETSGRVTGASEDTLDDLADAIVTLGKDAYVGTYVGTVALPPRDAWHRLPGISSMFGDVFDERFGADIFDDVDDLD